MTSLELAADLTHTHSQRQGAGRRVGWAGLVSEGGDQCVCVKEGGGRGLFGRGGFMFSFWRVGGLLWAGHKMLTILLCILKPQLFTLTAI